MSTQERDPLDILVNGEWATNKDIEYMESIAEELLETCAPLIKRQIRYELDAWDLNPALTLMTQEDTEDDVQGSAVYIELGDYMEAEANLAILFGYDNGLYDIELESSEEDGDALIDAFNIAEMLLDDPTALDEPGRLIVQQLKMIIEQFKGLRSADNLSRLPTGEHIADLVRRLVKERSTSAVLATEFSTSLSENHSIIVLGQVVTGRVVDFDNDKKMLQICYEDRSTDTEIFYCGSEIQRTIHVRRASSEDDEDYVDVEIEQDDDDDGVEGELKNDIVEDIIEQMLPDIPTAHDVQTLTLELLEAQAKEFEDDIAETN